MNSCHGEGASAKAAVLFFLPIAVLSIGGSLTPYAALDFGRVGRLESNDDMDTWDVTIGDEPVHKAKTVDDAVAY